MIWNGIYDSAISQFAPKPWTDWFAWRPVWVSHPVFNYPVKRVWLVRLQRRRIYDAGGVRIGRNVVAKRGCWEWEYHEPVVAPAATKVQSQGAV